MSRLAADSAATRPVAPRYQPLILILGAACLGILVDRRAGGSLGGWWSIAAAGLVCWSVVWRRGWRRTSSFVLLLAVAAAAAAWHHCRWCLYLDNDLGRFVTAAPQAVCADVVAIEGPVRLPADDFDPMRIIPAGDRSRLEVEIVRLRDGQQWRTASGRATLTVDGHLLGVHAGDRLRVFAQLAIPRSPQNPGEPDRAAYARRSRVRGLLRSAYPDCVTLIGRSDAGGPRRWLETVRSCGNRLLWQHIDPRRAPLASALLLGIREELGDDLFFLPYAPKVAISAKQRDHLGKIFEAISQVIRISADPIATGVLNRLLQNAIAKNPPPVRHSKRQMDCIVTSKSLL